MHQYVYGALNRLEEAVNGVGKAAKYQYNGLGHRVGKLEGRLPADQSGKLDPQSRIDREIGNLTQIHYTIDLTREYHNLLEKTEGEKRQTYFWDGNVASYEENGKQSYYLQDELGSPLRIADESGTIRESYGYGAFGEDLYGNQGEMQPLGYTGYQKDKVAGTYYAQAREYQADAGRFSSQDIIGGFILLPDTLNRYAYCWNAPIDYVDNDGEFPTIAIGALIGGAVGGIGSIISDVSKGKKINWGKAGKNALKGAAAGAVIGTGVGAVGALSTAGASTVAVNTAVAATAGASYRAVADIANSVRTGEMTISPFNRYITSATTGVIIYTSFNIAPRAATIGAMVQVGSDLIAGEVSSLESYGSAVFSTALMAKYIKNPTKIENLLGVAAGSAGTQTIEALGGVQKFSTVEDFALNVMEESAIAVVIALVAGRLGQIKYIKDVLGEDEWGAIIDGLRRKIENCVD